MKCTNILGFHILLTARCRHHAIRTNRRHCYRVCLPHNTSDNISHFLLEPRRTVDDYLDSRALLRNNTFHQVLQALIELADTGSEERSILESISNHLKARGVTVEDKQQSLL